MHVVVHLLHFGYTTMFGQMWEPTQVTSTNSFFCVPRIALKSCPFRMHNFFFLEEMPPKQKMIHLSHCDINKQLSRKKMRKRKTHQIHVKMCQSFAVVQCAMLLFFSDKFFSSRIIYRKFAHFLKVVNERSKRNMTVVLLLEIINNKFPTAMHFDRV